MDTQINYRSKYLAIAIIAGRIAKILHTTTESTLSSYGVPRWEDDWGNDYGQVDMPDFLTDIISIAEIDDDLYYRLYVDDGDDEED